jgi:hypothetical protein
VLIRLRSKSQKRWGSKFAENIRRPLSGDPSPLSYAVVQLGAVLAVAAHAKNAVTAPALNPLDVVILVLLLLLMIQPLSD